MGTVWSNSGSPGGIVCNFLGVACASSCGGGVVFEPHHLPHLVEQLRLGIGKHPLKRRLSRFHIWELTGPIRSRQSTSTVSACPMPQSKASNATPITC